MKVSELYNYIANMEVQTVLAFVFISIAVIAITYLVGSFFALLLVKWITREK